MWHALAENKSTEEALTTLSQAYADIIAGLRGIRSDHTAIRP